ncbi:uncharacterized protein EI97DRAFT_498320 [Westerdykella ornata]|uniref:Uncharacterized protein n=1 Tax=Westerdykella ornata TaxID=318751 RepID=A0A6A6JUZ0_WESOR|nr:uncharacterized protein EI97DRAFT_498320 [Westerdykella ornata]KAF2280034.1 hypothetical protein EI97DRAFT_498320 [Westerdykella ornata]
MGVSQVNQSFQNDGNFSEIDLLDVQHGGPIMRLETFRASHPTGAYSYTASGTPVEALAGEEHLGENSNRTFRMTFSTGQLDKVLTTLEMREFFDEDGHYSVYMRDVDGNSDTFGSTLISNVTPKDNSIEIEYKITAPDDAIEKKVLYSPQPAPLTEQVPSLVDISEVEQLNTAKSIKVDMSLDNSKNKSANEHLLAFGKDVRNAYPTFANNVQTYLRMGDFRDKCIHHGTNLTGTNPLLAAEFIPLRNYRVSLIMSGKVMDPNMSAGASHTHLTAPLNHDNKPGSYTPFLVAYAANVVLHQLGIDKVHSDYGGIPMKLKPGSRLETGVSPLVDSTNFNHALSLVSALLYAPDALPSLKATKPKILEFGVRRKLAIVDH